MSSNGIDSCREGFQRLFLKSILLPWQTFPTLTYRCLANTEKLGARKTEKLESELNWEIGAVWQEWEALVSDSSSCPSDTELNYFSSPTNICLCFYVSTILSRLFGKSLLKRLKGTSSLPVSKVVTLFWATLLKRLKGAAATDARNLRLGLGLGSLGSGGSYVQRFEAGPMYNVCTGSYVHTTLEWVICTIYVQCMYGGSYVQCWNAAMSLTQVGTSLARKGISLGILSVYEISTYRQHCWLNRTDGHRFKHHVNS